MGERERKDIVVIEDDVEVRASITFLIGSSEEFRCRQFCCAEDALKTLVNGCPDLVVMDIQLPGIDGIECTRRIKSQCPKTLILICTIFCDPEKVFAALKAGASGYLLKANIPDTLIPSLRELLAGGAPMSSQIARLVVGSFIEVNEDKDAGMLLLTPRERTILELLADGHGCREISERLFVSINTIRTHLYHIYDKLHVHNRVQAVNKFKSFGEEAGRSVE